MWHRIAKFLRTPKGLLTAILAFLILLAAPHNRTFAIGLGRAIAAAGALDAVILRVRKKAWEYPSGAVLSAAIVVMVLRWQEPWYVTTVTSVIAVVSKYLFRARRANVFNPAALAMVASYYLFHAGQSWWGAQTDGEGLAKLVLFAAGVFITNRVNKMPLVLTFLGAYFLLFAVAAFVGDPLAVAEVFRTPDLEAVLYFAFFILTDPPTSPTRYRDQVICGAIVAAVSYACFALAGVVYYLLAGVLAGNVWEAWRRAQAAGPVRHSAGRARLSWPGSSSAG
jgi:enediyne biosynthesis protein E5